MLLLPLGLALGSFLFIIFPELWVVILIKGTDISFKQSINKASYELSILPVPYEKKQLTKPFIDVVVDSVATGIAGFLLLFVIKKLDIDAANITYIILFFLFVWFLLVYRLRESYFDTFRKNIMTLLKGNIPHEEINSAKKVSVIDVLQSDKEDAILNLLHHSHTQKINDVYLPYLINLLDHPSDRVKVSALQELHAVRNKSILAKVKKLIDTIDNDEVIYEAMEYLLLYSSGLKDEFFHQYLDHKNPSIQNAALLCLANASRHNETLEKKYNLYQRISSRIEDFNRNEDQPRKAEIAGLLLAIGY
jgi:AAA family ATP:ADP antiporter